MFNPFEINIRVITLKYVLRHHKLNHKYIDDFQWGLNHILRHKISSRQFFLSFQFANTQAVISPLQSRIHFVDDSPFLFSREDILYFFRVSILFDVQKNKD